MAKTEVEADETRCSTSELLVVELEFEFELADTAISKL